MESQPISVGSSPGSGAAKGALDLQEDRLIQRQLKDHGNLPRHIAIIMDGDRRWAAERNLPRTEGHRFGRESVRDIVRACGELGIEVLTLYTFSTENWNRSRYEVQTLMRWLREALRDEIAELDRNNVRLNAIGRIDALPRSVQMALRRALATTRNNTGLLLNLALNYGGRSELVDAFRRLAAAVKEGRMEPQEIDETAIGRALYTAGMPDPDLLIRSSGEMRLSNFLPWQTVYTEIWFATEVHWPDFRRQHLYAAISAYQQRQRRFGGA
jgi:undecaprenyl diphosphate synthase